MGKALLVLHSTLLLLLSPRNKLPPLSQELGTSPTLAALLRRDIVYFDPLSIANDDNFSRLREAELKHGRVSMLAWLQLLVVPVLKKLDLVDDAKFPETIRQGVESVTKTQLLQVFGMCALLEVFIFVQQDPRDMPGDYGIGYFGVRDKGLHERSLVVELENGRLAMLALLYKLLDEYGVIDVVLEKLERVLE